MAVSGAGAGRIYLDYWDTRFEVQGSNTACLKGSIIINFKEIAAELKPL